MARLIGHDLRARYGADSVFHDVADIEAGVEFPSYLQRALERSDLFLALIGPGWARAESSNIDYVRWEVETAFANRLEVLPVLVEGGTMPSRDDLPASIELITRINAISVDPGNDFDAHMSRLYGAIERGKDTRARLGRQHDIVRAARLAAHSLAEGGWSFSPDFLGDQYVFLLTLKRFLESTKLLFDVQLELADDLIRGIAAPRRGLDDAIREVADRIPAERYWLRRRLRNETDHMREVHGALLKLLSNNRDLYSLVPNMRALHDHLSIWVAKYERFRNDAGMCLIFVGVEQHVRFPSEVEQGIVAAVDELERRLNLQ